MIARPAWGGLATAELPADVAILGVPFDGAVSWRPGAAEAPARLREISNTSPAVSEDGDVVQGLRVADLGDVTCRGGEERSAYFARVGSRALETLTRGAAEGAPFLLSLGGDHSVTIPLVRAFAESDGESFGLVLLDAHPDLFDQYEGSPLSHACPMRRALETGRLAPEHLLILGTRSYNAAELDFMREAGIRFLPARQIARQGVGAAIALARQRLAGLPRVYLTLDIDVADPACAPGTGAPVAGGLTSRELIDLTRGLLEALPVAAMDMVEVAPRLDPTGATLFLALQIVFETFAVLARRG